MKPFALPRWRKKHIREKYQRKDMLIHRFSIEMESVMRKAVNRIVDFGIRTGRFTKPSLNEMYLVTERFYRSLLEQAFTSAHHEKLEQRGKKRLGKLPIGLPRRLKDLRQVFNDETYWRRIMKRSHVLTKRLKNEYIQKLEAQFKVLIPKLNSGEYTSAEVKEQMMTVWGASKSRVETIFRTETTKYFVQTQIKFFSDDENIIGFLFDSVRDTSRTEICRSRHGLVYRPGSKELTENSPPCHFNCRSHLIALANNEFNRKLIEDRDRDPSKVRVVPLPSDWQ